ncbi:MAG: hypothetical protein OXT67_03590 [Zetaproteobacteria bacterium]|nr:hypothetical protein [Zetaproteobacteria bacterium]
MNEILINAFLDEDGDEYTRAMLMDCIQKNRGKAYRREFNFNQFNVILDFKAETSVIRDEFETGEEGEIKMSLKQFEYYLKAKAAEGGS